MGQSQRVIGKSVIVASSQDENSLIHLAFPLISENQRHVSGKKIVCRFSAFFRIPFCLIGEFLQKRTKVFLTNASQKYFSRHIRANCCQVLCLHEISGKKV